MVSEIKPGDKKETTLEEDVAAFERFKEDERKRLQEELEEDLKKDPRGGSETRAPAEGQIVGRKMHIPPETMRKIQETPTKDVPESD